MRDDVDVRTTLDIDEDVLSAAKMLSAQRGLSTGRILSELARKTLAGKVDAKSRNGVPLFPNREAAGIVTMELVNRLRDESV